MSSGSERDDEIPFSIAELLDAASANASRGFAGDEMIACEICLRANPPTRAACLYCGAPLPAPVEGRDLRLPALRQLEDWERGVNIILRATSESVAPQNVARTVADLLRRDADEVRRTMALVQELNAPLPLARAASEDEAALVIARLAEAGLVCAPLSDDALAVEDQTPVRVSSLRADANGVTFARRVRDGRSETESDAVKNERGKDERASLHLARDVFFLLAVGRIVTRRVETESRRKSRRAPTEVIEERELQSDFAVLDIYGRSSNDETPTHVRVRADEFDFSCLNDFGVAKALTAAENFARLCAALRQRAPLAVFDDNYARVRRSLDSVWSLDERAESHGLLRTRLGTPALAASKTLSNETQFTRYTRTRAHFIINDTK